MSSHFSSSPGSEERGACSAGPTLSPQELGERLRVARLEKGWTQEQAGQAVGLSRLIILGIEAGTRAVSSLELVRMAHCYDRQVEHLLEVQSEDNSPIVALRRAAKDAPGLGDTEVRRILQQFEQAVQLSRFLGENTAAMPPFYPFAEPRSYREAIEQGREMASLERKRLGLGSTLLNDVAALIADQSVWTVAVAFPQEISGLFLHSRDSGLAVLVNSEHGRARRRFSYAHEYGHTLADREKPMVPTSRDNASDLVEKRANAFASEFLLPEAGVWEMLERWQKGAASREYLQLYEVATNEVSEHEVRNDSMTQRITTAEVALLAHHFQVSYEVAAYRLSDIGAVRRPHLEELVSSEYVQNGKALMQHLQMFNPDDEKTKEQPYLKRQLVLLALEAHRRDKISLMRFREACEVAQCNLQEAEVLLQIARSQG